MINNNTSANIHESNEYSALCTIGYYEAPAGVEIKPHTIPEGMERIEIITGGKVFFEQNGQEYLWDKGTIFWHLSGEQTIHRTPPDAPYRCLVVDFNVKKRIRVLPRVTVMHIPDTVDDLTREAMQGFHDRQCNKHVLGKYLYSKIFWEAYRYTLTPSIPDYPPPIQQTLAWIKQHDISDCSVKHMANVAGVSTPYLFSLFNRYIGVSPYQYLLERRLQKAREMLATRICNIKIIAAECGFENIECFYRAFKKKCGMPPAEYRRRHLPYRKL